MDAVQQRVAEQLRRWGYHVTREPFLASSRPLLAVSVVGAACGWLALLLAPALVLDVPGWPVTLVGGAGLALIVLVAVGVVQGTVLRSVEIPANNLYAVRGEPRAWLVAHSDSKGQGVSLALRVAATLALALGIMALVVLLVLRLFAPLPFPVVIAPAVLVAAAGATLSRRPITDEAAGAVDNATGVVAALVAAEALRNRTDVGVLITDAEELAMAGARDWVVKHHPSGLFVNFDGVDSRGPYRIMEHRARGAGAEVVGTRRISGALKAAFAAAGESASVGRLPPGVLVDGVVLARAGLAGVTVSRGDWTTLRVVHTRRDVAGRVDVSAAVAAGQITARALSAVLG